MTGLPPAGFPHSDTAVSFASLQLDSAFRSLARPSSVSSGKAFSVRPSYLDLVLFSLTSRHTNACFEIFLFIELFDTTSRFNLIFNYSLDLLCYV